MQDRYGYEVTSSSARAVEHLDEAVRLTTSLRPGAYDAYKACLLEDPDFALAHAGLSFNLHVGGRPDRARESIATARTLAARGTQREQQHIEVFGAFMDGDLRRTGELGREHLREYPKDVRVVGLTIFALNLGGGLTRKAEALEFLTTLRPDLGGDGYFESALSFQMTENNLWDAGRRHAQIGLTADPGSFFAAHSVTHVHHEAGDISSGVNFLQPWLDTADRSAPYSGHLAWHLALFELGRGETQRAIAIFDRSLRPAVYPGVPVASLMDASSFLWRLNLYGVPLPEGAAEEVRELAESRFATSTTGFAASTGSLTPAIDRPWLSAIAVMLMPRPLGERAALPAYRGNGSRR